MVLFPHHKPPLNTVLCFPGSLQIMGWLSWPLGHADNMIPGKTHVVFTFVIANLLHRLPLPPRLYSGGSVHSQLAYTIEYNSYFTSHMLTHVIESCVYCPAVVAAVGGVIAIYSTSVPAGQSFVNITHIQLVQVCFKIDSSLLEKSWEFQLVCFSFRNMELRIF